MLVIGWQQAWHGRSEERRPIGLRHLCTVFNEPHAKSLDMIFRLTCTLCDSFLGWVEGILGIGDVVELLVADCVDSFA